MNYYYFYVKIKEKFELRIMYVLGHIASIWESQVWLRSYVIMKANWLSFVNITNRNLPLLDSYCS